MVLHCTLLNILISEEKPLWDSSERRKTKWKLVFMNEVFQLVEHFTICVIPKLFILSQFLSLLWRHFVLYFQMRPDIKKFVFHLCWSAEKVPAADVSGLCSVSNLVMKDLYLSCFASSTKWKNIWYLSRNHSMSSPMASCVVRRAPVCSNVYGCWFAPRVRHSVRLTYRPSGALQLLGSLRICHKKFHV